MTPTALPPKSFLKELGFFVNEKFKFGWPLMRFSNTGLGREGAPLNARNEIKFGWASKFRLGPGQLKAILFHTVFQCYEYTCPLTMHSETGM